MEAFLVLSFKDFEQLLTFPTLAEPKVTQTFNFMHLISCGPDRLSLHSQGRVLLGQQQQ